VPRSRTRLYAWCSVKA